MGRVRDHSNTRFTCILTYSIFSTDYYPFMNGYIDHFSLKHIADHWSRVDVAVVGANALVDQDVLW